MSVPPNSMTFLK